MSVDAAPSRSRSRPSGKAAVTVVVSVLLLGITITWAFFSMRAVMDVGGACADGGPYVSSQPCPDGSFLIAIAIPVMLVAAMVGSAAAFAVRAPNLLLPMWAALFGALGWNFLEYAVKGPGIVWGWMVCGVMFWLMAAPAVFAVLVALKGAVLPPDRPAPDAGSRWWVPAYSALAAVGFLVGAYTYSLFS